MIWMSKKIDVIGQRFGKLTVIEEAEPHIAPSGRKFRMMLCKCDCGNTTIAYFCNLRNGTTVSCGCYNRKKLNDVNSKYEKYNIDIQHNKSDARLYRIHQGMKSRCYNKNNPKYEIYGNRGISICEEWLGSDGFINFYNWAVNNGYSDKLSIDRINNDGNYEPSNCRWATQEQQMNNRSINNVIDYNGTILTATQWAKVIGVDEHTILRRLYNNYSEDVALFKKLTPLNKKKIEVFKDNISCGVFDSIVDASKYIGALNTSVSNCLTGRSKTVNGYTVKQINSDIKIDDEQIDDILKKANAFQNNLNKIKE